MKDVDRLFEDELTPPALEPPPLPSSGFPEDPPELRERLVSAIGGECSDLSLLPARFEQFASKTEDALKTLAAASGISRVTGTGHNTPPGRRISARVVSQAA